MMNRASYRLIARLDIKGPNLVKTVQLEGLRVVGDPQVYAQRYFQAGVDELIYMDIVASLYSRNNLSDIVSYTAENIFVPLTVGGGIRAVEDVRTLLLSGADKIALNTAAIKRPELISEIADRFGSQCVVLSIEAKSRQDGTWECYTDNGRERTGLDVLEWARRGQELGAGEVLITSVDREGTRKGYDLDLYAAVSKHLNVPMIASGGMSGPDDLVDLWQTGGVDAAAMADILHFERSSLSVIRQQALERKLPVRPI